MNDHIFCYRQGSTLYAHDPFTGERFWTVEDVSSTSEIFADGDYVLRLSADDAARVLTGSIALRLAFADTPLSVAATVPVAIPRVYGRGPIDPDAPLLRLQGAGHVVNTNDIDQHICNCFGNLS